MDKKKSLVDASELTQIIKDLYKFIRSIDVGCAWHNEYLEPDEIPCICFKRQSIQVEKLNANIKGSYEAELPFDIYYRNEVKDTKQTMEIVDVLNNLSDIFERETDNDFKKLKMSNDRIIPVSLEMTETPADESGIENNKATFRAAYKFRYKKKGDFE